MVVTAHQHDPATARGISAGLAALAEVAAQTGVQDVLSEIRTLAARIAERRYYVACVGQFKRGKSSLLNALLGEPLLPTGVVPATSIITIVRHGTDRRATVHTRDGRSAPVPLAHLAAYVSESGNPGNGKNVAMVEVSIPHTLLATGMCLVDTPGLGSTFPESTALTEAFVPHIDAALVVLGADPPLSLDELALIGAVAAQTDELILVLNKADRVPEAERQEARRFSEERIAERLGRPLAPMLEASAIERLADTGPSRDWDALVNRLGTLSERSGRALLRSAEERGVEILGRRLLRELVQREAALLRPVEETAARVEALRLCASEAERSLGDLRHLLDAEQEALHQAFARRQEEFLACSLPEAQERLREALRALRVTRRASLWRAGNTLAQGIFRRLVDEWRGREQPVAERMYLRTAQRFVELANGFLGRLSAAGEGPSLELPPLLSSERGFRTRSRLYFTELLSTTTRSPLRWLLDGFRTSGSFRAAVDQHAHEYLERLMRSNASRVTGDLDEQVLESRRGLERAVRERLRHGHRTAQRALQRAKRHRALGEAAVAEEVARTRAARARIDAVLAGRLEAR
jgi:GTP-binding protein EngB required for normal cell division